MSKAEFAPDQLRWLSALAGCKGNCPSADLGEKAGIPAERAAAIEDGFVKTLLVDRPKAGIVRLTPDGCQLVAGLEL